MIQKIVSRLAHPFPRAPHDDGDVAEWDPDQPVPMEVAVQRLLTRNDGPMWQGEIIARSGWSAPKTSRVLSKMEAHDQIVRQTIGKRKAVYMAAQAPAEVQDEISGDQNSR